MDNPEKLTTQGTQDEEKQNKNTTQYVLDTTICKQTQIMKTFEQNFRTCTKQMSNRSSHYLVIIMVFYNHFQQYFSYIVKVSFIEGRNRLPGEIHRLVASH